MASNTGSATPGGTRSPRHDPLATSPTRASECTSPAPHLGQGATATSLPHGSTSQERSVAAVADALYKAMKGLGTDEEAVYQYLSFVKTPAEWHAVRVAFHESYPSFHRGDVVAALTDELTVKELATCDTIMRNNGIDGIADGGDRRNTPNSPPAPPPQHQSPAVPSLPVKPVRQASVPADGSVFVETSATVTATARRGGGVATPLPSVGTPATPRTPRTFATNAARPPAPTPVAASATAMAEASLIPRMSPAAPTGPTYLGSGLNPAHVIEELVRREVARRGGRVDDDQPMDIPMAARGIAYDPSAPKLAPQVHALEVMIETLQTENAALSATNESVQEELRLELEFKATMDAARRGAESYRNQVMVEADQMRQTLDEKDEEIAALRDELAGAHRDIADRERELADTRRLLSDNESASIQMLEKTISQLNEQLKRTTADLDERDRALEAQRVAHDAEMAKLQASLQQLQDEVQQLQAENDGLRKAATSRERDVDDANRRLDHANDEIDTLRKAKKDLQEELDDALKRCRRAELEQDAMDKKQKDARADADTAEQKYRDEAAANELLKKESRDQALDNDTLKKKNQQLADDNERLERKLKAAEQDAEDAWTRHKRELDRISDEAVTEERRVKELQDEIHAIHRNLRQETQRAEDAEDRSKALQRQAAQTEEEARTKAKQLEEQLAAANDEARRLESSNRQLEEALNAAQADGEAVAKERGELLLKGDEQEEDLTKLRMELEETKTRLAEALEEVDVLQRDLQRLIEAEVDRALQGQNEPAMLESQWGSMRMNERCASLRSLRGSMATPQAQAPPLQAGSMRMTMEVDPGAPLAPQQQSMYVPREAGPQLHAQQASLANPQQPTSPRSMRMTMEVDPPSSPTLQSQHGSMRMPRGMDTSLYSQQASMVNPQAPVSPRSLRMTMEVPTAGEVPASPALQSQHGSLRLPREQSLPSLVPPNTPGSPVQQLQVGSVRVTMEGGEGTEAPLSPELHSQHGSIRMMRSGGGDNANAQQPQSPRSVRMTMELPQQQGSSGSLAMPATPQQSAGSALQYASMQGSEAFVKDAGRDMAGAPSSPRAAQQGGVQQLPHPQSPRSMRMTMEVGGQQPQPHSNPSGSFALPGVLQRPLQMPDEMAASVNQSHGSFVGQPVASPQAVRMTMEMPRGDDAAAPTSPVRMTMEMPLDNQPSALGQRVDSNLQSRNVSFAEPAEVEDLTAQWQDAMAGLDFAKKEVIALRVQKEALEATIKALEERAKDDPKARRSVLEFDDTDVSDLSLSQTGNEANELQAKCIAQQRQLERLKEEVQGLHDALARTRNDLEEARDAARTAEEQAHLHEAQVGVATKELAQARDILRDAQNDAKNAERETELVNKALEDAQHTLGTQQKEIELLCAALKDPQEGMKAQQEELATLRQELRDAQQDLKAVQTAYQDLADETAALKEELQTARDIVHEHTEVIEVLNARLKEETAEKAKQEEEVEQLRGELCDARDENEGLQRKVEDAEGRCRELLTELDGLRRKLDRASSSQSDAQRLQEEELDRLRNKLARKEAEAADARRRIESLERDMGKLRDAIKDAADQQDRQHEIDALKARLKDAQDAYKEALKIGRASPAQPQQPTGDSPHVDTLRTLLKDTQDKVKAQGEQLDALRDKLRDAQAAETKAQDSELRANDREADAQRALKAAEAAVAQLREENGALRGAADSHQRDVDFLRTALKDAQDALMAHMARTGEEKLRSDTAESPRHDGGDDLHTLRAQLKVSEQRVEELDERVRDLLRQVAELEAQHQSADDAQDLLVRLHAAERHAQDVEARLADEQIRARELDAALLVERQASAFGGKHAPRMRAGARVKRNDNDWKWGTQDGGEGGLGTVKVVDEDLGWVCVKWDRTGVKDNYRWNNGGAWDVVAVPGATEDRVVDLERQVDTMRAAAAMPAPNAGEAERAEAAAALRATEERVAVLAEQLRLVEVERDASALKVAGIPELEKKLAVAQAVAARANTRETSLERLLDARCAELRAASEHSASLEHRLREASLREDALGRRLDDALADLRRQQMRQGQQHKSLTSPPSEPAPAPEAVHVPVAVPVVVPVVSTPTARAAALSSPRRGLRAPPPGQLVIHTHAAGGVAKRSVSNVSMGASMSPSRAERYEAMGAPGRNVSPLRLRH